MCSVNLQGKGVILRAMEPEDLDLIYVWENDPAEWDSTHTRAPYSRYELRQFIETQSQGALDQLHQQRFMVCDAECVERCVGMVDIYDYDSRNRRAGVGIFIDPAYRRCGFALNALFRLEEYLVDSYELHQVWAEVASSNTASRLLFERAGYGLKSVKKEWLRRSGGYEDELFYQKIL